MSTGHSVTKNWSAGLFGAVVAEFVIATKFGIVRNG